MLEKARERAKSRAAFKLPIETGEPICLWSVPHGIGNKCENGKSNIDTADHRHDDDG